MSVGLAVLVAIVVVEAILEHRWNPAFYSHGVRLFRAILPAAAPGASAAFELPLAARVSETGPWHAFRVRRVATDLVLFRGGLPVLGDPRLVGRGSIRELPQGLGVELQGLVSWSAAAVAIGLASFGLSTGAWWFSILVVVGAVIFVLNAREAYALLSRELRHTLSGETTREPASSAVP